MTAAGFPRFKAVADRAVLAEFGETIDEAVHGEVLRLDAALAHAPPPGFVEAVPAYASVLVVFDPALTDHGRVERALRALLTAPASATGGGQMRDVDVCYEPPFAPDLPKVAEATGLSVDGVIAAHLAGEYRVFMYGFAPGYAYLAGVPEAIRLPRKTSPMRGVSAGSVIVAGPQCLVTTLTMPTGWWVIGRSPTPILRGEDAERPFLFDVGDGVRFRRVGPERLA